MHFKQCFKPLGESEGPDDQCDQMLEKSCPIILTVCPKCSSCSFTLLFGVFKMSPTKFNNRLGYFCKQICHPITQSKIAQSGRTLKFVIRNGDWKRRLFHTFSVSGILATLMNVWSIFSSYSVFTFFLFLSKIQTIVYHFRPNKSLVGIWFLLEPF